MPSLELPSSKSAPPVLPPPEGDPGSPHLRLLAALGRAVQQVDPIHNRRIFVNRTLRMDKIDLIGFDMDYTLAIYNQPRIEALSVACTLRKMVDNRGYPQEILGISYDPSFAIRGLVVDRQNGNLVKMDRYGYVGRCYHGGRLLSREERGRLYHDQRVRLSHPRYAWIDTLFALPEAVLYARNVEILDRELAALPPPNADERAARYDKLWRDIRECIDEAHRDESMKRVIKANLADYLEKDDDLAATLHRFRSSGKRLFLLTNSALDYTEKVMSYLLDGELPNYPSWRHYFDAIVVDARKPAFFSERHPLYELSDDGQIVGQVLPGTPLQRTRVYQGGNVQDFQTQIGQAGPLGQIGDQVLYVGDHIYGDMLRAKKSSVWRTAMILQELEQEMTLQSKAEAQLQQLEALERRKNRVDAEISYQQLLLRQLRSDREARSAAVMDREARSAAVMDREARSAAVMDREGRSAAVMDRDSAQVAEDLATSLSVNVDAPDLLITPQVVEAAVAEMRRRLDALRAASRGCTEEMDRLEADIDRTFNPYWGPLFKEGAENSRFGEQVEAYACLYTSRVSNFLAYSPLQYFRSPRDHLPHERVY